MLSSKCDLRLHGWCDADWAGCLLTRRSLTGWIIFIGDSLISWKMKKQHIVSRLSEVEYRSITMTTCKLKWLKRILSSFNVIHTTPMLLHCDSQAALHISQNPIFYDRTKHIEVDCHLFVMPLFSGILVPVLFLPMSNLQIFLPRHWKNNNNLVYFASWAFEIFTLEFEGIL